MPVGEPKILQAVKAFLERQRLDYTEQEEKYCDKLTVRSGAQVAYVSIYNTGKIVLGGKDSPLKTLLGSMAAEIEAGQTLPGQILPFEIERFPETLKERVPDCDPVVIRFIEEAIRCYRADAILAAAFMLGAASEKAINTLICSYAESINDQTNRDRFRSRVNGRMISRKWEEFQASYKGCQNKATDPLLSQDIDVVLGSIFNFIRVTRNEIGHPQTVPDLDRGAVLANLGHFVTYIERIYALSNHFKENGVVL